jgi:hypothetical protein
MCPEYTTEPRQDQKNEDENDSVMIAFLTFYAAITPAVVAIVELDSPLVDLGQYFSATNRPAFPSAP